MALMRLGGAARPGQLDAVTSRRKVAAAVASGEIIRAGRPYVVPTLSADLRAAAGIGGVLSPESAALQHGWAVKQIPDEVSILVSKGRHVRAPEGVRLRSRRLDAGVSTGGAFTDPVTTLLDCAKALPFDAALAVAGSAVRTGSVGLSEARCARESVRTRGRTACLRVAHHVDGRAANPFESVLRALAVDHLDVEPQVAVDLPAFRCHPDRVDVRCRFALEADSWEFHGGAGSSPGTASATTSSLSRDGQCSGSATRR